MWLLHGNLLQKYIDFLLDHYSNLSSVQSLVLVKYTFLMRRGTEWLWIEAFRVFPFIYSKLQEATNVIFKRVCTLAPSVPKHTLVESILWKLANTCYRHMTFTFQNVSSISLWIFLLSGKRMAKVKWASVIQTANSDAAKYVPLAFSAQGKYNYMMC